MKLFTVLLESTGNLIRPDRVQVLFGVKNMVRVFDVAVPEQIRLQAYVYYGDILN